ncbi:GNAT family N-acetyltransferase [Shinella daejeonensis]|uniref:GNAT family N-acetyltransferase n=1 Tax=Shinella daejeonensis TaxID=659017 RepID=UPI0020C7B6D9|nr:GNAT family N-acetyltransferase [Shinella daejeonensis]MCP8894305.1 GNAT family N-acetyltransferase [Shinella daejeonensis]
MIVRPAESIDRSACIDLLHESHEAAGFTWPFLPDRAGLLFDLHCTSPLACCLVLAADTVGGLLLASVFDHPFGAGFWAKETVWYVTPSARGRGAIRMLDAYEDWAKNRGCAVIGMASLATNDVSSLYARRGYAPAETHFIKHI